MRTTRGDIVSGEVTNWLVDNVMPLRGLAAGTPRDDLQPLRNVLGNARVVGLGEATHGTREFFRLKHRLLEFLVTEMDSSVLAMEASASAGPAVDAYVRHGVGDAATVLTGLGFWTWRTYEVLAVIEWLRAYNRGRAENEKVRFVGIDPQRCGASITVLDAFLKERAPGRVAGLHTALGVLADAYPGHHPDPRRPLVCAAQDLVEFLSDRFPEAHEAARHAQILARAADLVSRDRLHEDPQQTVYAARDRYLADAVREVLAVPSAKVAVWAHNGHIAKNPCRDDGPLPLGHHLSRWQGDAYYALGLLFGKGSFRAFRVWPGPWAGPRTRSRRPVGNSIGRANSTTVEGHLAAAGHSDLLLDLPSAADAPPAVQRWLHGQSMMRSFGAYVPRWSYRLHWSPTVLAQEYDGLAYVDTSTDSRPLPPIAAAL